MHRATTCAHFTLKGETIANFSPLRFFVKSGARTLIARTSLGGAAESERSSKKSCTASPSGASRRLAPSSRLLADTSTGDQNQVRALSTGSDWTSVHRQSDICAQSADRTLGKWCFYDPRPVTSRVTELSCSLGSVFLRCSIAQVPASSLTGEVQKNFTCTLRGVAGRLHFLRTSRKTLLLKEGVCRALTRFGVPVQSRRSITRFGKDRRHDLE